MVSLDELRMGAWGTGGAGDPVAGPGWHEILADWVPCRLSSQEGPCLRDSRVQVPLKWDPKKCRVPRQVSVAWSWGRILGSCQQRAKAQALEGRVAGTGQDATEEGPRGGFKGLPCEKKLSHGRVPSPLSQSHREGSLLKTIES